MSKMSPAPSIILDFVSSRFWFCRTQIESRTPIFLLKNVGAGAALPIAGPFGVTIAHKDNWIFLLSQMSMHCCAAGHAAAPNSQHTIIYPLAHRFNLKRLRPIVRPCQSMPFCEERCRITSLEASGDTHSANAGLEHSCRRGFSQQAVPSG